MINKEKIDSINKMGFYYHLKKKKVRAVRELEFLIRAKGLWRLVRLFDFNYYPEMCNRNFIFVFIKANEKGTNYRKEKNSGAKS